LEIREKVSKELEVARQQKVIGHSLNAAVDLYPNNEMYRFLMKVEDQLATIFIVSSVKLFEPGVLVPEEATQEEDLSLAIKVSAAPGEKCERCWTFSTSVGEDKEHPTLCRRCSGVVKSM
jgi:isoleucyl-tRNA synthetase